jgi:hypothetical protein
MYQDKNGWTPLCEGLPNDGQECFVWFKNDLIMHSPSWCFTVYTIVDNFGVNGVTHWRPVFGKPIKKVRSKSCQH